MSIFNFPAAAASAGGSVFRVPTSQTTGTVATTGVDVSDYTGNALFILWVTASATGRTCTAKLQESSSLSTGYTDVTGGAFTGYTSGQSGLQHLALNVDGLKQYVRLSTTVAGGAVTNGGLVEGWKNY